MRFLKNCDAIPKSWDSCASLPLLES